MPFSEACSIEDTFSNDYVAQRRHSDISKLFIASGGKKFEAGLTFSHHPRRLFRLVDAEKSRRKPRSHALAFSSSDMFIIPQTCAIRHDELC